MKKTFISALFALLLCSGMNAKVIYVTVDGDDSGSGTSWDNAVKTLSVALSKANKGDDIYMAAGTYTINESIMMKDGVSFYGGFAKGQATIESRQRPDADNQPWNFTNETIITGSGEKRLMEREDKSTLWDLVTIDGITFKDYTSTADWRLLYFRNSVLFRNNKVINCACLNGTVVYGEENFTVKDCYFANNYGLGDEKSKQIVLQFCGYAHGSITNRMEGCTFENNSVISFSLYNYNGGPQNEGDEVVVTKCIFRNNTADCFAFNYDWSEGTLGVTECLFEGNKTAGTATVIGGSTKTQIDIVGNIIRNNQNTTSDPVGWRNSIISLRRNSLFANNLVINNTSSELLMDVQGGSQANNTIAQNKGSVYLDGAGAPNWYNNITAGNEATPDMQTLNTTNGGANDGCFVEYNGLSEAVTFSSQTVESNNLVEAAPFVRPTGFVGISTTDEQLQELISSDFSLNGESAFNNAGDTDFKESLLVSDAWIEKFMAKDIAGNNRIVDGKINIGAYQGPAGSSVQRYVSDNNSFVTTDGNQLIIVSDTDGAYEIYNIAGLLMEKNTFTAGENSTTVSGSGIYLVKVSNKAGAKTYKIMMR